MSLSEALSISSECNVVSGIYSYVLIRHDFDNRGKKHGNGSNDDAP